MKTRIFLSMTMFILFIFGVVPKVSGKVIDRVVAVVNNEPILLSEVDSKCKYALEQVPASMSLDKAAEERRKIRLDTLDTIIDETLMQQQIKKHHIEVKDEEVERYISMIKSEHNLTDEQFAMALKQEGMTMESFKARQRKQIEKQKLLGREIQSKLKVSEKDIEQYYRQHYMTEAGSEKVKASHILFSVPPDATKEQQEAIYKKAKEVLAKLRAGADFAEMAKKYSDDPSASTGGDLGWFRRGDMVASFEKAAFSLKKGQVSDLVKTRFGYHIIMVKDRASDKPPALDKVSMEIRRRLTKELEGRLMRNWLDDLRRHSYIEIKL